jgi:hypothetical protein
MLHKNLVMVAVLIIAALQLSACQKHSGPAHAEHPAEVVPVDGTDLRRVTLTDKAMQRIALKTDQVREQQVARADSPRLVVPYSSLIYDPHGQTWLYISPEPRSFLRHKVEVDYIEGDIAVLRSGPPVGTVVASVGVAELYGTEFKVGH